MSFTDFISPALGAVGLAVDNENTRKNRNMQKDFARMGIRWKVADAKAAGIHPLAALGANTMPFNPVYGSSVADDLSNIGQDVSRAIDSTRTLKERAEHAKLDLEAKRLQVEGLSVDLQNKRATNPPMATLPGNKLNGTVDVVKARVVGSDEKDLTKEAGVHPGHTYYANGDGSYTPIPSERAKEGIEDMTLAEMQWQFRNLILPKTKPPFLPKGATGWKWKQHKFAWYPVYPRGHKKRSKSVFRKLQERGLKGTPFE